MRVLAVDLGTSNTVAVLAAHGRPPRAIEVDGSAAMPSAVFAGDDGTLLVGREAERRARLDPARFEPNPKRRIDDGTLLLGEHVVPVPDALAAILRRVATEVSRQLGGAKPDEVRLTHPAQWGPVRRNVLLAAARQAGLGPSLVLVPEPVAAAAHFASFPGQSLRPGQSLAVYDLGAGTFDVAVVGATQHGFTVLAEHGLPDLGGLDVDQALLEYVGRQVSHRDPARWQRLLRPETTADRRAQRALREDVKAAKESLSSHVQTEVPMPEPFDDVLVTRAEMEALIRSTMLRSVELLATTIRSTGMSPDRLAGIYLVGGSSRIPLAATLIAEQLRVVPASLDQPETAVALGAYHVPQEGISMRTDNIGGAVVETQRTVTMATPSGPLSSGPPSGPTPVPGSPFDLTQPVRPQPVRQLPPPVQRQPPHHGGYAPPGGPPRNRKPLPILAVAAVALIAAVVTIVVVVTNGTEASGSGSGGAACAGQSPDSKGFTSCMRELAGSVADDFRCVPGFRTPGTSSGTPVNFPNATVVTCEKSGYSVYYWHVASEEVVRTQLESAVATLGTNGAQARTSEWNGGGMAGTYYDYNMGTGVGLGMFTVHGRPLLGMLMKVDLSSGSSSVKGYFESAVRPG